MHCGVVIGKSGLATFHDISQVNTGKQSFSFQTKQLVTDSGKASLPAPESMGLRGLSPALKTRGNSVCSG